MSQSSVFLTLDPKLFQLCNPASAGSDQVTDGVASGSELKLSPSSNRLAYLGKGQKVGMRGKSGLDQQKPKWMRLASAYSKRQQANTPRSQDSLHGYDALQE